MFRYIAILVTISVMAIMFNAPDAHALNAAMADLTKYNPQPFKCIGDKGLFNTTGATDEGKFTELLVNCVQAPVRAAVLKKDDGLLAQTTHAMTGIVLSVATLAIVWLGIRTALGDANFFPRAISLALRIVLVILIINQAPYFAIRIYEAFDQMVAISLPAGVSPWVEIDKFLSKLLGFTEGFKSMKDGIIGLLEGSLFAKNLGIMVSMIGSFAIISLLGFIAQALYLYLASVIAIGFLLIIAPFIVPLFMFSYTEKYFLKWFDILLASIISPMMMFAFLSIFLVDMPATGSQPEKPSILMGIANDIFKQLPENFLNVCLHENQPVTRSYLNAGDVTDANTIACSLGAPIGTCTTADATTIPSIQSTSNPFAQGNLNFSPVKHDEFNCGDDDNKIKKSIFMSLMELLFFTILMNTGLKLIPGMAERIAGGATSGVANLTSPLQRAVSTLNKSKR